MAKGLKGMRTFLENKGVTVCGTTEDFYGTSESGNVGLWCGGEDSDLFNYWSEAWANTFGVNPKLDAAVNKQGWYFEWNDAGTIMCWPD